MRDLDTIATLTTRVLVPGDPVRVRLLDGVAQTSGLSEASLDRLVAMWADAWQRTDLDRALRRGLGQHPGAFRPVGRVGIVAPGNLCVATWQAILEALLVGNSVSVRPGSGDPQSPENLQQALALVDPQLAARIQIVRHDRADEAAWLSWLGRCDALSIYGGKAAISGLLRLAGLSGFAGRVRVHGHYTSFGVLDVDLIEDEVSLRAIAQAWAVDALLADGRGCMSLRALWLVGPLEPPMRERVREALRWAMTRVALALPPGRLAPEWLAEAALEVETHAFAAANDPRHWVERGEDWAVLGVAGGPDPRRDAPGPGARVLSVYEARDATELIAHLRPWQGGLSTASVALDADSYGILDALEGMAVHRTCQPGSMQAPRADRAPDGHLPFTGLVRQTDRA